MGKCKFREMGAFLTPKVGLVLGFNFGTKKGPRIQTLPYFLRGGSNFGRCFGAQLWPRNLCRAGPKFRQGSGPCLVGQRNLTRFSLRCRSMDACDYRIRIFCQCVVGYCHGRCRRWESSVLRRRLGAKLVSV